MTESVVVDVDFSDGATAGTSFMMWDEAMRCFAGGAAVDPTRTGGQGGMIHKAERLGGRLNFHQRAA
jgi:hypothetical protein